MANLKIIIKSALAAGLTVSLFACAAQLKVSNAPQASQLLGTWKVDLRPTPGSDGYYQEFVVSEVNGKTFKGTFYGTEVTQARINTDWYQVRIAFVTEDQSGPYYHSAVLTGQQLDGLSNATGRDFLSYWSAVKK